MKPDQSPIRFIWIGFGFMSLSLGIIGIALPVLPTVPFVLLAAYFFSKGSTRYHRWIHSHRYFGPMVVQWEKHGCISTRAKTHATIMILLSISLPLYFFRDQVPAVGQIVTLVLVTMGWLFVITRPSSPQEEM